MIKYNIKKKLPFFEAEDLRELTDNPITALYLSPNKNPVVEIKSKRCRVLRVMSISCSIDSGNPFINTLIEYEKNQNLKYSDTPLKKYYDIFKPNTVSDVFQFDRNLESITSNSLPAIKSVFPWERYHPDEIEAMRRRWASFENRKYLGSEHEEIGVNFFGPVSNVKGQIEYDRLKKVYNSIKRYGYKRTNRFDEDITGYVIYSNPNNYVVMIDKGNHRICSCVALKIDNIPIRLTGIKKVNKKDVEMWPNVINGIYSKEQAHYIFNKVLIGTKICL